MILEIVALSAVGITGLGIGLLIGSKTKLIDGAPSVKVLKLAFTQSGDIFVNMIEYEDKRSISYSYKTSGMLKNDNDVDDLIRRHLTGIHNHLKLWLNFDINTYPDVTSIHGVSYV